MFTYWLILLNTLILITVASVPVIMFGGHNMMCMLDKRNSKRIRAAGKTIVASVISMWIASGAFIYSVRYEYVN